MVISDFWMLLNVHVINPLLMKDSSNFSVSAYALSVGHIIILEETLPFRMDINISS